MSDPRRGYNMDEINAEIKRQADVMRAQLQAHLEARPYCSLAMRGVQGGVPFVVLERGEDWPALAEEYRRT
jgi:hypothetical protein